MVVYVNYCGLISYGKDFVLLLDGKYSLEEDFVDYNLVVDVMIVKGFIDKDNLFIVGGLVGGIVIVYVVGLINCFNVVVIIKLVINWLSKILIVDSYIG